MWLVYFFFAISVVLSALLGVTLGKLTLQRRDMDRLLRDQRIAELERDLDMNLPALRSIQPETHPLAYVLGVMAGLWIRERARGRRW